MPDTNDPSSSDSFILGPRGTKAKAKKATKGKKPVAKKAPAKKKVAAKKPAKKKKK